LILYHPGLKNKSLKIKNTVQLVDVMPSLIDMLKLHGETKQIQGTSFFPLLAEGGASKPAYSESLAATEHFGAVPLRSVQNDRYKFIQTARSELYDLQHDPAESKNLMGSQPDEARAMEQELNRIVRTYSRSPAVDAERISSDAQEQLSALGYVSGGSSRNPEIHKDRDPKDFLEMWKKLNILAAIASQENDAEMRTLITEFRRSGVVPTLVSLMDAQLLIRQKRFKEAETIIKEAIREDDRNLQALTLSGEVCERTGKPDEAAVFYRRVVEIEKSPAALETFIEQMNRLKKPDEVKSLVEWMKRSGKWSSAFDDVLKKSERR
jgi:tetratricopeptide (TPR) repeat protein